MADAGSSPFTLRDILKHTVPTIIALCLFIPFYSPLNCKIKTEALIFSGVILGYILEEPISFLAHHTFRLLPQYRKMLKKREWLTENWDYTKFFYLLPQEDKEYFYLTSSYIEFYRAISFYLFIYLLINISRVGYNFIFNSMTLRQSLNMLISMIGDWQVPMWVALIFAVLALVSCSINFFREYKSLFLEEGQYVKFAEKYHTKDGNIAKSIWGVVKRQNKALEKATVELHKTQEQNPNNQTQHKCLGTITSDEEGHFQFKDTFSECLGSDIKIRVIVDKKIKDFDFSIDEKKIPFFEIDLDKIALVQNIPEVIASGDQNKQA